MLWCISLFQAGTLDVKYCLAGYLSPPAINGYQAAIMGGGIWDTYPRYGPNKQSPP